MDNNSSLRERSKVYEDELTEQFAELSEKAIDVGKQALIVAGGVFVAYQLVKLVAGGKRKKKKAYENVSDDHKSDLTDKIIIRESKHSNSLLDELKAEVSTILIDLAKAKIYELLRNLSQNNQHEEESDTGAV
jgi:hypothetical protein